MKLGQRVKLGIVTPGLTLFPRAHAQWEETATFADIVDDRAGRRAARLPPLHVQRARRDPGRGRGGARRPLLRSAGDIRRARRASTATIRFAAHVVVLGYHHPLAIAKRYGTLDAITAAG